MFLEVWLAIAMTTDPSWYRRHRESVQVVSAQILLAIAVLLGIFWAAQPAKEPQYRASAWLRMEDSFRSWRANYSEDFDPQEHCLERERTHFGTEDGLPSREYDSPIQFLESTLDCQNGILRSLESQIRLLRLELQNPTPVTLLREAEPSKIAYQTKWFSDRNQRQSSGSLRKLTEKTFNSTPIESLLSRQVQLINSSLVFERVLSQPEVANYPPLAQSRNKLNWLFSRTKIQARGGSELFIVSFTCSDPEYAATIANAIVDSYFQVSHQAETKRLSRLLEVFEQEHARRSAEVAQLQAELNELQVGESQED